jgi:predicted protein tyrosine phosphatase
MMRRPLLNIAPIFALDAEIARFNPDYVISITDPRSGDAERIAALLARTGTPYTGLAFHDIDKVIEPFIAPSLPAFRDMCQALDRDLPETPGRLLVHCHAGLSRSPAVAMIALAHFAQRDGDLNEEVAREIAREVFKAQPLAIPNKRILRMGTSLFGAQARVMAEEAKTLQASYSRSPVEPADLW